ncbi:MAG TPA: 2'-5' RNA ligase family protein [Treponemataceae bacterium]|nr:2'-5' RNA ligase family protein [Treponemataceae bacterium]
MEGKDEQKDAGRRAGMNHIPGAAQTHFVGVLASEGLSDTLLGCRRWMGEAFGCRSGFLTPMHVTLIPPFALRDPEEVDALARAIERTARAMKPFAAHASGFGAFGERTVFARVAPDPRWAELRDALFAEASRGLPGILRKDARPFTPHLTVANRDIPIGAIPHALEHFAPLALDEEFPVDHIALFERRRGTWETAFVWEAGAPGACSRARD